MEKGKFERKLHQFENITKLTTQGVVHYTCNAPSMEVLEKYGIKAIGDAFGIEKRGILIIPEKVYEKYGLEVKGVDRDALNIRTENLLARLK